MHTFEYLIETAHQKEKSQGGKFLTGLQSGLGDRHEFCCQAIEWPYCLTPEKDANREQKGYAYAVVGGGRCSNKEEPKRPT